MAKAELEAAQYLYDVEIQAARESERRGEYRAAIRHAVAAWDHVEGMMKFEKRWENAEFKSVPCIDIVLRHAPLILDSTTLHQLADLLRKRKTIDRMASDNLATRLAGSQGLLREVHRLWELIERQPRVRQDTLRQMIGGQQETWRWIVEQWELIGLIDRTKHAGSYLLKFATDLGERWRAKCPTCGAIAVGAKRAFLEAQKCPRCQQDNSFVLLGQATGSLVEKK